MTGAAGDHLAVPGRATMRNTDPTLGAPWHV